MSQPTPYAQTVDFSTEETNQVSGRSTLRTAALDTEFANIQLTLTGVLTNLRLLQRDDGELLDGIVTLGSLSSTVLALLSSYGSTVRGQWLTATAYSYRDIVETGGASYICVTAHTSGVFATDKAAGKWIVMSNPATATTTTFTATSTISAANVQAAIEELDTELRINVLLSSYRIQGGV